jgi:hypothetical protein
MSKIGDVENSFHIRLILSLPNLEAASEEAMQLRRLIKSSKKAYDIICLGNLSFGIFRAPELRYQGGGSARTPPPHGTVPQKAHI